ncbi:transcription elongation factor [Fulvimarina endophytica]|uniref:Transcription elongation factor n=1 Tax=Fulvimarina endophytica TaxID=2293836 RepID=A0A371X5G6_9HYPH|nr:GreA/GreB family elongation factor [Fulvimarina endophytica]RFC64284.1 transcription elongation factor [Fulvimarina endophytica]
MSVAFVKEPNEDQVEVLPDRDLGSDPNIVTRRGLSKIDEEIDGLNRRKDAAREAGDKVAIAHIDRDLRYWLTRRATADVVVPPPSPATAQFGCRVTIEREDGREQSFTIVGIDEADPGTGYLSYLSPLARSLVNKGVGDEIRIGGPKPQSAEIVAISAG